jgi:hypothetical protein
MPHYLWTGGDPVNRELVQRHRSELAANIKLLRELYRELRRLLAEAEDVLARISNPALGKPAERLSLVSRKGRDIISPPPM